jgi:glycosyltransferase involved in cell wall biosynthesis
MKLSVVIPCYNVARYARAAVMSALNQTLRDIEVIVINDGSTDDTRDVLRTIETLNDPRLKIIDQPNGGLAAARNTGIKAATGEYIAFLDGDDLWYPEKAERHIALMDADPTIGMTHSGTHYLGQTGGVRFPPDLQPTLYDMIRQNQCGASLPIVRGECFKTAGLFDERLRSCEDWEMWCRILHDTGLRAVLIPEVLYVQRLRQSSLSHQYENFLNAAETALTIMQRRMPEVPTPIFREARAMMYRFTAWRAAASGHRLHAMGHFAFGLRQFPALLWRKPWDVVTILAAILLPRPLITQMKRVEAKKFLTDQSDLTHSAN